MGVIEVKLQKKSHLKKLHIKMKLLIRGLQKWFSTSVEVIKPWMEVFGVVWGQNKKLFKPGQFIYQNQALAEDFQTRTNNRPKGSSWSSKYEKNRFWGHKNPVHKLPQAKREAQKKRPSTNCLERCESLRRRDRPIKCLERSERLRRRDRSIKCLERSEKLRRRVLSTNCLE